MSADKPGGGAEPTVAAAATVTADAAIERPPVDDTVGPVPTSLYRFISEEGRGGLGRVMRARDKRTQRLVAVKEMLVDSPAAAERFRREAMITANLQHPGIVPVYEVGHWRSGQPFYAMKLVEGRTLREVIEEAGGLAARLGLLHHVTAVAEALAYAHSRRIIHRDLKPSNILAGAFGETLIIDWGLAKDLSETGDEPDEERGGTASGDSGLTRAGSVIGTPAYMAPEQARGEPADERSDVYALGCVLYHLLTGEMPYSGSDSVVDDLLAGPPASIAERLPDAPADLRAIVERAMARDPRRRYADASEVAADLRRFETGKLVAAHAYSTGQLVRRWVRRHRGAVAVGVAAAVGLAVLGAVSFKQVAAERDVAERQRALAETAERDAIAARESARGRLADVHEELGRRELSAGEPFRALAHLAETAAIRGELRPGLRYLSGRALEPATAIAGVIDLGAELVTSRRSADRRWAAFATAGDRIDLWSLERGVMVARVSAPGRVHDVAITGGGRLFAATGAGLIAFRGDQGRSWGKDPVSRVAVDESSGRVFAARIDGRVEVRSLDGGDLKATWEGVAGPIDGFELVAGGRRLLIVADDSSRARLLDTASGKRLVEIPEARYHAASPDGSRFLLTRPETTEVFDASSGRRIATLSSGRAYQVLMPSAARVLTANLASEATLWDARSGERVASLEGHTPGNPIFGDGDREGRWLATSFRPGTVRVWELASGHPVGELRHPSTPIFGIAFGDERVVAAGRDGLRLVWERSALRNRQGLFGHRDRARRIAYNRDGSRIATGGEDGTARIWNPLTGDLVATIAGHDGRVTWVELAADGRLLTADAGGTIRIAGGDSWEVSSTLSGHQALIQQARWSADGRLIASIGEDGTARIWDVAAATERCRVELPAPEGRGIELSAAGDRAMAYGAGGTALVFATAGCAVLARLKTPQTMTVRGRLSADGATAVLAGKTPGTETAGAAALFRIDRPSERIDLEGFGAGLVASVELSPDGTRVVAGDVDGEIAELDASGRRIRSFEGVDAVVGDLAYDPSGTLLFVGTDPGELVIFDRATGDLLERIDTMGAGIYQLRVRPDGRQIATAALDPIPRLWTLPRFSGSVDELRRAARCSGDWQLGDGGRLVRRPLPACD